MCVARRRPVCMWLLTYSRSALYPATLARRGVAYYQSAGPATILRPLQFGSSPPRQRRTAARWRCSSLEGWAMLCWSRANVRASSRHLPAFIEVEELERGEAAYCSYCLLLFELEQRAPPGDQALDASWGASSGTRGRGARAGASGAKTQHDSKIDRADMRPSTLTQRADASRLTPDDHHATPPHSLPDTTPRPIAPPSQPPFRHPTRCRLIRPSHTATFLRTPAHPGALPSPLLSSPRLLPCLVFNLSLN